MKNQVRILFSVAAGLTAIGLFTYTNLIVRLVQQVDTHYFISSFFYILQIGALLSVVFLYKRNFYPLIAFATYMGLQVIYTVYNFSRFGGSWTADEFFRFGILQGLTIPINFPDLSISYLQYSSGELTQFIGTILALVGAIMALAGGNKEGRSEYSMKTKENSNRVFVPAGNAGSPVQHSTQASSYMSVDALDQIERLGDLLKKGLITKEEFEIKKRQILGL